MMLRGAFLVAFHDCIGWPSKKSVPSSADVLCHALFGQLAVVLGYGAVYLLVFFQCEG